MSLGHVGFVPLPPGTLSVLSGALVFEARA